MNELQMADGSLPSTIKVFGTNIMKDDKNEQR